MEIGTDMDTGSGARSGDSAQDPDPAGRGPERQLLAPALDAVRSTGAAFLLRGDPGMGKTALLDWAEDRAGRAGLRVLRMAGAEAESALPFAALHQVMWPLLDTAHRLPDGQRRPLEAALGMRADEVPSVAEVAGAALALLAGAAARRPIVMLLDGLQWADPSSAAVFRSIGSRAAGLPLVVIGATRHEGPHAVRAAGRPIDLEPLDDARAGELLRGLHPHLAEWARRRVLRAAGGNPLALRELPAELERAAPDRLAVLADPESGDLLGELPLGERVGGLYEDRLRALPEDAHRILLLAALGGPAAPTATARRSAATTAPGAAHTADGTHAPAGTEAADTWRLIEDSGLARVDPRTGRVIFHHPLVRAGLVHIASSAQRRAAHRRLAETLPPHSPQRIAHLAAAAIGPDDELAALLDAAAQTMAERGAEAEAASVMARAAGLTAGPEPRSARLVAAAALAARGGRLRFADRLLSEAENEARPGTARPTALYALAVAYVRLHLDGDPTPSIEGLPAVLDAAAPFDAGQRAALLEPALFVLVIVAAHTGDERARAALERHVGEAGELTALCHQAWADPPRTARAVPARLRAAVEAQADGPPDPLAARLLLWTAMAVDSVSDHAPLWDRPASRSTYVTHAFIELARTHDDFLHGRWDRSLALARRGAAASAAHGYGYNEMMFLLHAGQVLAGRGDTAGLEAIARVLSPWAADRNLRLVTGRLLGLKALCALGHGRAGEAWHHVRSLTPPGVALPRLPWIQLTLLDFAQAAVESGHRAEARAHLRAVRAAGIAAISPHHAFLVAGAEALAAADDAAEERYAAVYALPGAEEWPFELARLHLAHGASLRRRSRRREAAARLTAAHAVFERLRTAPWAGQAARELAAATGPGPEAERAERPAGGVRHPLSAQESRIAELAAEGLTNREIGARLRLSPRTVGAHLYKIFPKLGITTRGGMARALRETGTDDTDRGAAGA
ncbi:AAA family ATPase [Streptomyces sp. NPDC048272]|uniref:AAA family ATPase n=1 Tax=Streptomyces sp. NPDC048272 TaxID=3154616 RepID=UPI003439BF5F